jgi:hypothetical protein
MRVKSAAIVTLFIVGFSVVAFMVYKAYSSFGTRPAGPVATAISKVRGIYTSEMLFYEKYKRYGTLSEMAEDEGRADPVYTKGADRYYRYKVQINDQQVEVFATPIHFNATTNRAFYLSSSKGSIHVTDQPGKEAGADDPTID